MSELVVFVFRDQYRAPEVLNELRRRDWFWVRDLDEAVAVSLNIEGKATVQLSINLSKSDAGEWARIWASLLGSTLFLPLTDLMVEAVDGIAFTSNPLKGTTRCVIGPRPEARWWRDRLELSDTFMRDVAALLRPGGSAIFMVLRPGTIPIALEQLRNYGDTILHTSLSANEGDEVLAVLARE
jgi:uncharacterized membrane protein